MHPPVLFNNINPWEDVFVKKSFKLLLAALSAMALSVPVSALVQQADPIETHAVSTTRLYIVVTDELKTRSPGGFQLHTGSATVTLSLLTPGDNYTYYTDSPINNAMTFKNSGGSTINLYNIAKTNYGITWDMFTFKPNIAATLPSFDGGGETFVTKSVYVPSGVSHTVSLYNGENVIGTQSSYESTAFVPTPIVLSGYRFINWYSDSGLTTLYSATIFMADASIYGKYIALDMVGSFRLFVSSSYSWWYDASARIDIEFWKDSGTHSTLTMFKETGSLHSVILPNRDFNKMILIRKDPATGSAWNTTGTIPVDSSTYDIMKLTGALANGFTGPMTSVDFTSSDPYVSSLTSGVPALSCSNYSNADTLMATYNGLAANEKTYIDGLRTGAESLTYSTVLNYYVGWKSHNTPASPSIFAGSASQTSMELPLIIGLCLFALTILYFFRQKRSA